MSSSANLMLPLQFNQLIDLVKKLPQKEKMKLMNVLEESSPDAIPAWQKKEVRKRIKKYEKHPELLVDEKTALKIIKAM
ncbi:MAG TPA: addiction module protein [Chitinophagaceae bacterium]|nr:addiction module protein [Chitinophagaceae bacterium]